jgi:hypothetical protein
VKSFEDRKWISKCAESSIFVQKCFMCSAVKSLHVPSMCDKFVCKLERSEHETVLLCASSESNKNVVCLENRGFCSRFIGKERNFVAYLGILFMFGGKVETKLEISAVAGLKELGDTKFESI